MNKFQEIIVIVIAILVIGYIYDNFVKGGSVNAEKFTTDTKNDLDGNQLDADAKSLMKGMLQVPRVYDPSMNLPVPRVYNPSRNSDVNPNGYNGYNPYKDIKSDVNYRTGVIERPT